MAKSKNAPSKRNHGSSVASHRSPRKAGTQKEKSGTKTACLKQQNIIFATAAKTTAAAAAIPNPNTKQSKNSNAVAPPTGATGEKNHYNKIKNNNKTNENNNNNNKPNHDNQTTLKPTDTIITNTDTNTTDFTKTKSRKLHSSAHKRLYQLSSASVQPHDHFATHHDLELCQQPPHPS